ncbi:hypothetical protein EON73_04015 [bacterium]|nr:MAG: hypothetical protein EON73_04015 [bacterium]
MGNEKNEKTNIIQSTNISEFNASEDKWVIWKERLDIHYTEINCTDDSAKRAILLKSIGSEAYETLRCLCDPDQPIKKDFASLCKILDEYYTPPTIIYHERKIFHDAVRRDDENVSAWYARIKKLALQCKFGAQLDVMVKDKFITQLPDEIFTRLCEEDETLTLTNALKKALILETKFALRNETMDSDVNFVRTSAVQRRQPNTRNNNNDCTGEEDTRTDDYIFKIPSEWVNAPHLKIRYSNADDNHEHR